MEVIIVPTFKCNFDCSYCSQKFDKNNTTIMDLDKLEAELKKIKITSICLLGGELSILPKEYLDKLLNIVEQHNVSIDVFTNLYNIVPRFQKYNLYVSFDFHLRQYYNVVFSNMMLLDKFSISTTVTKSLLNMDTNKIVNFYNSFENLNRVIFNHYHTNKHNRIESTTNEEYVDFIIRIKKSNPKFTIENLLKKQNPTLGKIVLDPDFSGLSQYAKLEDRSSIDLLDCINCDFICNCTIKYSMPQNNNNKCIVRKLFI